ncbi:hypothetical protein GCM10010377_68330 [Streptomyces viridiviolaceus]|uniref:Cupredoxin domain-containing protein n=1 Tax=Streptomyces viridiviolaceus TaxID=68282 RepID=A0ABW2E7Y1_9ACTN|nr:cupredoxin domain-containing protein [Streptomyces viridiviolaceus]GHB67759.1 hypothetical protein GCM10010377_68330 [Streptomyces viridiviolaceus]
MTSRLPRTVALALLALSPLTLITACAEKTNSGGGAKAGVITVEATDDACKLSRTSAPSGSIAFEITNGGNKITEFYLFNPEGHIVSEVEGITPGISRKMTVKVTKAGKYATACKPGMIGDGIRGEFTVTAKRDG